MLSGRRILMTSSRSALVAVALVAAFAAGAATAKLTERPALAFTTPFTSTLYVSPDGLALRTFEGHVIARVSCDDRGGVIVLYDRNERPSNVLHADPVQSETLLPPAPASNARTVDLGY
jgi:hypothetical protein